MAKIVRPVHEGTFTTLQEQLQVGYVEAVAATAGCSFNVMQRDTFGIDGLIVKHRDGEDETRLFVQLKCTTTPKAGPIPQKFTFTFKHKHQIDKLRTVQPGYHTLLLVMITHPSQTDWTVGDHQELRIRHCCYWKDVQHAPADETKSDLSVKISKSNVFDAAALNDIMDRIQHGEEL